MKEVIGNEVEFPRLRWIALAWLLVWTPAYWHTWGGDNFLLLCDVAVFLTVLGLWRGNSLLLSSQAVSMLLVGILWVADLVSFGLFGWHILGGTEYFWDARYPFWVRALSIYHILLPLTVLRALRQVGYDARGWKLQSSIAVVVTAASRWGNPAKNLNFAFSDPIFHRAWGPAPVHLTLILGALIFGIYVPTHLMLARCLPGRKV